METEAIILPSSNSLKEEFYNIHFIGFQPRDEWGIMYIDTHDMFHVMGDDVTGSDVLRAIITNTSVYDVDCHYTIQCTPDGMGLAIFDTKNDSRIYEVIANKIDEWGLTHIPEHIKRRPNRWEAPEVKWEDMFE